MPNWPQHGDSLFASGLDWEAEAKLGESWHPLLAYAMGYKEAADTVVEAVIAKKCPPDSVGYAVCFLYRHFIELMLKGLINLGTMLEERREDYPRDHSIYALWTKCRPLLELAFPNGEKVDTDAVENCIREMATLDPSGEAFRYAEDKKGRPTLRQPVQLDLANMRDVMDRMSGFLGGSYDALDELVQLQADIDADNLSD